jgi:hypothetical protein
LTCACKEEKFGQGYIEEQICNRRIKNRLLAASRCYSAYAIARNPDFFMNIFRRRKTGATCNMYMKKNYKY